MSSALAKKVEESQTSAAEELQRELGDAHKLLRGCFEEMETLLAQPVLYASALTSVRLKLASLRLTRGSLVMRIGKVLAGSMTESEAMMIEQLRTSHHDLLQSAAAHTCKWTLAAIENNWTQYRQETGILMSKWNAKAEREQKLVYPLLQRCAGHR